MRFSPDLEHASDVVFRGLFSGIFFIAGIGHFGQNDAMVQRLLDAPLSDLATALAPAPLLVYAAGVVLILGGLALLLGRGLIRPRLPHLFSRGPRSRIFESPSVPIHELRAYANRTCHQQC